MERLEREVYKMSIKYLKQVLDETEGIENETMEKQMEIYCRYYRTYDTQLKPAYDSGIDSEIQPLKMVTEYLEKMMAYLCMKQNGYYLDTTYEYPEWQKTYEERNEEYENN